MFTESLALWLLLSKPLTNIAKDLMHFLKQNMKGFLRIIKILCRSPICIAVNTYLITFKLTTLSSISCRPYLGEPLGAIICCVRRPTERMNEYNIAGKENNLMVYSAVVGNSLNRNLRVELLGLCLLKLNIPDRSALSQFIICLQSTNILYFWQCISEIMDFVRILNGHLLYIGFLWLSSYRFRIFISFLTGLDDSILKELRIILASRYSIGQITNELRMYIRQHFNGPVKVEPGNQTISLKCSQANATIGIMKWIVNLRQRIQTTTNLGIKQISDVTLHKK